MTDRPIIGVLLDYEETGSFSTRPHYALRQSYFDAVWRAGGLPVGLGYLADGAAASLDVVQGLVFPGGTYPFPAHYYDEVAPDPTEVLHPRHAFESSLITAALARNLPILGICAGMQLIAAQAGVKLFRNLKAEVDCAVDHLNEKPAEETAHSVAIMPETSLRVILGKDEMMVNTAHNEAPRPRLCGDVALDRASGAVPWPDHIIVSAIAPDGVIEGLERTDRAFCIGVQWHPEFFVTDSENPNARLFEALVDAAQTYIPTRPGASLERSHAG